MATTSEKTFSSESHCMFEHERLVCVQPAYANYKTRLQHNHVQRYYYFNIKIKSALGIHGTQSKAVLKTHKLPGTQLLFIIYTKIGKKQSTSKPDNGDLTI